MPEAPPTKAPESCTSLAEVRAGIDQVDREIVALLARRSAYVLAAAAFKDSETSVRAPARVAAVLASRRAWADAAGISSDLVGGLFDMIVRHGIAAELSHFRGPQADALTFRRASEAERPAIIRLLESARLPSADLPGDLNTFTVVDKRGELVGAVGLEVLERSALLRSLVVAPKHRGTGLGVALCDRAIALAALLGVESLWLLTTSAPGFFARFGFAPIDRAQVPTAVRATTQFAETCPSTAQVMVRQMGRGAIYFPKDLLALRPDVPGAQMFGVALDRALLTYFELAPGTQFDRHTHEGEQITLVLGGELAFSLDGRPPAVLSTGEAIALPGGVPHAVSAGPMGAKAVDAWSPPFPRYR